MIYCRHCGERRLEHARKLCRACHRKPDVREQYSSRQGPLPPPPEPTEAELEAMIARRMRNLPAWFIRENEMRGRSLEADIAYSTERAEYARNRFRMPRQWRARA